MLERYAAALLITLALALLILLFVTVSFTYALKRLRKAARNKIMQERVGIFWRVHKKWYEGRYTEALFFSLSILQQLFRIAFALALFSLLLYSWSRSFDLPVALRLTEAALIFMGGVAAFMVVGEVLPRVWSHLSSQTIVQRLTPLVFFLLLLFFPAIYPLYAFLHWLFPRALLPFGEPRVSSKETLLDLIADVDDSTLLGENEKKLLQAVLTFRDRVVREVMVPRVDLFCLHHDCSLHVAAELLHKEGYSRVPIYKETQDHIVGILMYKDILAHYMAYVQGKEASPLELPVEKIMKPILYSPETKKISQLLQEFRKKRKHIAVVVDEYGGTAGIITIEDILEELVGEIADEYDDAASPFRPAGKGSWMVDARMNLLDLEEELGIKIPQEGDYDTISGYLFFRLGTIPRPGTVVHHDDFEIEVVASNDRTVERVRILPRQGVDA